MSRLDELADMVYTKGLVEGKAPHEIAAMIARRYAIELTGAMRDAMSKEIDGDAPQHDAAVTKCIRILDYTAI